MFLEGTDKWSLAKVQSERLFSCCSIYLFSLCSCFDLISRLRTFTLLVKPISFVNQSSCRCQTFKTVPLSAAVSCHFTARSMQPSSTSSIHHIQHLWGPFTELHISPIQCFNHCSPPPPSPPVSRIHRRDILVVVYYSYLIFLVTVGSKTSHIFFNL